MSRVEVSSRRVFLFVFALLLPAAWPAISVNGCTSDLPRFKHVVIVVEENHSYSDVIGNTLDMPYLNSLANQYGLATQFYANTHPSIGNYFMMTSGQLVTSDDNYPGPASVDNVVRQLILAGKTWKSYAESLPSVGYTSDGPYPYARRHNPLSYFSDVVNDATERNNLVPFSQFASDLNADTLPDYSFIVPNLISDGHDGSLAQVDTWLSTNIAPLINSAVFQNAGLLIILFDESLSTDTAFGGGHVPVVIVSPQAKKNFQSSTFYQHENVLALSLRGLGLCNPPGAGANATDMPEFFTTQNLSPAVESMAVYPNPFVPGSGNTLHIVHLPPNASVRIHALTGELLAEISADGSGNATCDGRNHAGDAVASGLYFVLSNSAGAKQIKKLAITR